MFMLRLRRKLFPLLFDVLFRITETRRRRERQTETEREREKTDKFHNSEQAGFDLFDDDSRDDDRRHNATFADASDYIVDIREYDVPYHVRVMIDMSESAPATDF